MKHIILEKYILWKLFWPNPISLLLMVADNTEHHTGTEFSKYRIKLQKYNTEHGVQQLQNTIIKIQYGALDWNKVQQIQNTIMKIQYRACTGTQFSKYEIQLQKYNSESSNGTQFSRQKMQLPLTINLGSIIMRYDIMNNTL